jgi:pilus assembly protein CpaC
MSLDFDRTPELADLPILGTLFRSARYRRDETELVILITPMLVKPVRDRGLATPLDRPAPALPPGPAFVKAKQLPEPNSGFVFK